FTVVVACLPQSHELRYYLSWMIVLVSINLWLACRPGPPLVPFGARGLGGISAIALAVVLAVTRAGYAYPSGSTFADLVHEQVDERLLAEVQPGERVCVQREPWNLLWADTFHAPRRYSVKEAEERADCGGDRLLE